jgi:hypothetical protein
MNGVRVLQTATSNPDNGGPFYIGVDQGGTSMFFAGYISNVRILKGTALYSGTTYTVPTSALTAITNTSLLTLQNKYSHNTTQGHQDSSTNQLLITSAGSPAAGNFSPFSQTGWSNYFNGSTDYVSAGSNSAFAFGTGAYTVEFWVYPTVAATSYGSTGACLVFIDTTGGWGIYDVGTSGLRIDTRGGGGTLIASSTHYVTNSWNHVVAVRSGTGSNLTSIFLNGTRIANGTDSANWTVTGPLLMGAIVVTGYYYTGYMSNVRVVKGTAVYDPTQTTITVPTAPLTAISGTSLLACQSNRFIDNSTNAFSLTPSGTPSVQAFSPFAPASAYSQSTVSGSIYFNGSTDYLSLASSSRFDYSLYSTFTFECWVYVTNLGSFQSLFGTSPTGSDGNTMFYIYTSGQIGFGRTGVNEITSSTGIVKQSQWTHIAFTGSSGTFYIYCNGVQVAGPSTTSVLTSGNKTFYIGFSAGGYTTGYISNFRFSNNVRYSGSSYTVPSVPFTSDTNTVLLTSGTSTALTDVSSRNNLVTVGSAKISTASKKYGTGSMYFNGSTDYMTIPFSNLHQLGSGDFSIELWIYPTSVSSTSQIVTTVRSGATNYGFAIYRNTTSILGYLSSGNSSWDLLNGATIGTVASNNWYHVAMVRSGTNVVCYLNGTSGSTTSVSTTAVYSWTTPLVIGAAGASAYEYFSGYIDDLRITKGYARYTSNFTPMTSTFNDK